MAQYLRLSVEDGDIVSNEKKAESNSIVHQRELIAQYISDKQLYPSMRTLEFVDDGYSGTNFDRPAVKKMLSMVREGKICCIIVKDISRFGRNYLEVGDYLEQIFPFMEVRFIAVNDGYDSDDYIGTTGGIEIAFKSLLYDMYSKDLSEKMRSSLAVRRNRGDFIGPRALFGYQFSENKKVLEVDTVAARYVKQIFHLACRGYGTGKIAKIMNKEKAPTPGQYKNQKDYFQKLFDSGQQEREKQFRGYHDAARQNQGKVQYHIIDGEGYWDSGKVRKVLNNKVYLGTVVNGKNQVTEVGGSKFRKVPDEEQICVPGRHEAIITEQEFLLASEVIKNRGCQSGKRHNSKQAGALLGKIRCGYCKRSLIRIDCTKIPYFTCKKVGYEEKSRCISERLSEPELESAVLEYMNQKLEQDNLDQKNCQQNEVLSMPDRGQMKQMCMTLEQKRDSLKIEKQYLYEQYKRKQMERRVYLNKVEALREEENSLCEQIEYLRGGQEKCEEDRKLEQKKAVCTGRLEILTREAIDAWIDTIYVYGNLQFDIIWKEKT